ncbi:MAG: hypothetical protein K6U12_11310 [Armatimonadetes bacterium]|nr:hypothetical protein [Armatimonadota bacterium]
MRPQGLSLTEQMENTLRQLLDTEADTLAQQIGFTKRRRKLTGSAFAKSLLTAVIDTPLPTYANWLPSAAQHGVFVSPQALAQRCTPQAAQRMEALLQSIAAGSQTPSFLAFWNIFLAGWLRFNPRRAGGQKVRVPHT